VAKIVLGEGVCTLAEACASVYNGWNTEVIQGSVPGPAGGRYGVRNFSTFPLYGRMTGGAGSNLGYSYKVADLPAVGIKPGMWEPVWWIGFQWISVIYWLKIDGDVMTVSGLSPSTILLTVSGLSDGFSVDIGLAAPKSASQMVDTESLTSACFLLLFTVGIPFPGQFLLTE